METYFNPSGQLALVPETDQDLKFLKRIADEPAKAHNCFNVVVPISFLGGFGFLFEAEPKRVEEVVDAIVTKPTPNRFLTETETKQIEENAPVPEPAPAKEPDPVSENKVKEGFAKLIGEAQAEPEQPQKPELNRDQIKARLTELGIAFTEKQQTATLLNMLQVAELRGTTKLAEEVTVNDKINRVMKMFSALRADNWWYDVIQPHYYPEAKTPYDIQEDKLNVFIAQAELSVVYKQAKVIIGEIPAKEIITRSGEGALRLTDIDAMQEAKNALEEHIKALNVEYPLKAIRDLKL